MDLKKEKEGERLAFRIEETIFHVKLHRSTDDTEIYRWNYSEPISLSWGREAMPERFVVVHERPKRTLNPFERHRGAPRVGLDLDK